jgi:hypothetical protein
MQGAHSNKDGQAALSADLFRATHHRRIAIPPAGIKPLKTLTNNLSAPGNTPQDLALVEFYAGRVGSRKRNALFA